MTHDYTESNLASRLDGRLVDTLVLGSVAYLLLFNLADESARTAMAGALGLVVILRSVLSWPDPASVSLSFLLLAFIVVPLAFFVFRLDPRLQDGSVFAGQLVRFATCIAVLHLFSSSPRQASPRLLLAAMIAILATAAAVAATQPLMLYAETLRPASFTGGIDGVHSAGYVLIIVLLGLVTLWRCGWLALTPALALAAPLVVLIALFQVRTTWTMGLVYALVAALSELRARDRSDVWLAPTLFVGAAAVLAYASSLDSDYSEMSSGRTEAYAERIQIILGGDLTDMMFGTGLGSEMITNTVWWWEAKNSHNDFLDITIQTGFAGLAMLLVMLVIIASRLDRIQLPLFIAAIVSSAISNGLLGRPFVLALMLALLRVPIRREVGRPAAPPAAFAHGSRGG